MNDITLKYQGTPSGGGFSPLPTTSGSSFSAAQSPLPYKDPLLSHRTNYATLMRSGDPSLSNPEFQIQNEDFPALPGAIPGDITSQAPSSMVI
uniref:EGR1 n=1 Tax=Heterorhabditis bacteriophora TaxID=37862 RepID=A0A1I7XE82_HETBA